MGFIKIWFSFILVFIIYSNIVSLFDCKIVSFLLVERGIVLLFLYFRCLSWCLIGGRRLINIKYFLINDYDYLRCLIFFFIDLEFLNLKNEVKFFVF